MKLATYVSFIAFCLPACSSAPQQIEAAYVSPQKYEDFSCGDISTELRAIERRSQEAYERLRAGRWDDSTFSDSGLDLSWPVLFALAGDGPEADNLAQLKGEFVALHDNSSKQNCNDSEFPAEETSTDDLAHEIRAERNEMCPRRSTKVGYCRQRWEDANPVKAAIIEANF